MHRREIARQQHADLVRENFLARIVDNAAAVTVAVEAKSDIGPVLEHRLAHSKQHMQVFGIGIIFREVAIEFVSSGITSRPIGSSASGANAPAVPLPQAATTFSLRLSFGRFVSSAI